MPKAIEKDEDTTSEDEPSGGAMRFHRLDRRIGMTFFYGKMSTYLKFGRFFTYGHCVCSFDW